MFFTQVVIPVLIVAGVCFWAGLQVGKEAKEVSEAQKKRKPIRLPPKYDRKA